MPDSFSTLVVGAGFAGAVMAERLASQLGQRVLVIDRRDHIGGNDPARADPAGRPRARLSAADPVVAAVVRGSDEAALERTRAALDAQARAPDVRQEVVGGWSEAWGVGRGLGADWTWLLDADSVVPEPAALAELLRVLDAPGDLPAPALLTSRVLAADGALDPDRAPVQPLLDREVAIAAARRRVVAVRLARWGSLLVAREVLAAPPEDFVPEVADLEWTSRVLRERPGYLVARSVARRAGDAVSGPSSRGREQEGAGEVRPSPGFRRSRPLPAGRRGRRGGRWCRRRAVSSMSPRRRGRPLSPAWNPPAPPTFSSSASRSTWRRSLRTHSGVPSAEALLTTRTSGRVWVAGASRHFSRARGGERDDDRPGLRLGRGGHPGTRPP